MNTLIAKIQIGIYIFLLILLIITVYFTYNLKSIYVTLAIKWVPFNVLHSGDAPIKDDIKETVIKEKFKSLNFNAYVFEPNAKSINKLTPIVWFTGHYFISTHVNKYFYQYLCYHTKRSVIVFEYPTIVEAKLDEIIVYIDKLLSDIFTKFNIKSILLCGGNSGCFYALIYADLIKNLKLNIHKGIKKDGTEKVDIKTCIFADGIYNVSTLTNSIYRKIFSAAIGEISGNANNDTVKLLRHFVDSEKRVIPVKMEIMSSVDSFNLAINQRYAEQDYVHRKFNAIDDTKMPFFWLYKDKLELVAKWFENFKIDQSDHENNPPLVKRRLLLKVAKKNELYKHLDEVPLLDRLNNSKAPEKLKNIILRLKLHEIKDDDERSKAFISVVYDRQIRSRTAIKYYEILQRERFFGASTVKPNPRVFDAQVPPQERVPPYKNVMTLIEWCKNNKQKYPRTYVILFAYYSGLRAAELCKFTNEHLVQLKERHSVITVKRKWNSYWEVTYHEPLVKFIDELLEIYKEKVRLYYLGIVKNLFNVTPNVLSTAVRNYYMNAVGDVPPAGFGIHVMRYIIGTRLAEDNELAAAQRFLGHKQLNTTKHYVHYDLQEMNKRLNHVINTDEFYQELLDELKADEKW